MSNRIRLGDTIISKSGGFFEVQEVDALTLTASSESGKRKIFRLEDLHCIDHDDGLWQEMEG